MPIRAHGDVVEVQGEHAKFTVRPNRGGIVTAFEVDGTPILFMDDDTLADPTKNVRGGMPVLFPTPGKLADDTWSYGGWHGAMKQHGFARNLPWRVVGTLDGSALEITLELGATAETRTHFPWDFALQITYALRGTTLRIDQHVTNRGTAAMPFGVGFHPYFFVRDADKARARVATAATRAFDNVAKRDVALAGGIDLTRAEVDLHLLDHDATASALSIAGGEIAIRGSAEYTRWVVWTLAGKDFVCLEPWTCPGNAINTGDRVMTLAPGQARSLWLEISYRAR
jgi:galactose mutarotase-like enzyme